MTPSGGASVADWDDLLGRGADVRSRGKIVGVGFANYVESAIGCHSPERRSMMHRRPTSQTMVP